MTIPMLVMTVKICGWSMLTTRMRIARKPDEDRRDDRRLRDGMDAREVPPAGRLLSRAMANVIRIVAVCTARQQTVTAITTQIRKILPTVLPRTSRTTYCRPPGTAWPISGALMFGTDISANSRMSPPMMNDAMTARRIAFGAVLRGSRVSSPSELAVSNPYMT